MSFLLECLDTNDDSLFPRGVIYFGAYYLLKKLQFELFVTRNKAGQSSNPGAILITLYSSLYNLICDALSITFATLKIIIVTIGLITCKKLPALTASEQLLIPIFARHNINATSLVWDDETINWSNYDYLIFRSIWDSHLNPVAFSNWLRHLKNINVKTFNPVDTVQFNQHKFYLKYLEQKGVAIIPTLFIEKTDRLYLGELKNKGWKKAVIKPAISASAYLTELFDIDDIQKIEEKYHDIAIEKDLLVQQFMPEIQSFGELSLIFFNKKYAHTVLKTAKDKDFRVQYEYGGKTKIYYPDKTIIETAEKIVKLFDGDILYARVDGVIKNNELVVMEIELIEPELFFEYGDNARERFVEAAIELMNKQ